MNYLYLCGMETSQTTTHINNKYFIIDFDSTFIQVEAMDELAEITLKSDPNKEQSLIKIQEIKSSPLQNHKRLKVQKKIIIPFSEDEVLKVIDVFGNDFEGKRNLLIVDMLYSTGIRREELINIEINDLQLNQNLIKTFNSFNS